MKFQMVMIIFLLCNSPWLEDTNPSFARICQYLSSTVPDLARSIFNYEKRDVWKLCSLRDGSNLSKHALSVKELKGISLLGSVE
jgi:hypothetical protein